MKFSVISLGCPKNLVDSEIITSKLIKKGHNFTYDYSSTDIIVINTCAFLKSAVKESEKVISYYAGLKRKKKIKKIIVCGCLVSRYYDSILKKYPEIDLIVDVNSVNKINKLNLKNRINLSSDSKKLNFNSRFLLTSPHSVYVKVADGCDNFCSYCTIPYIRGRYKSKSIKDVVNEIKLLSQIGVKEVSLIAQDTTKYGYDLYGDLSLIKLLERIENIKDIKWIRLMYLYPSRISKELVKHISESSKICNYIEMPVQHISDKILKSMNRNYDSLTVYKKIELIRKYIPDVAIRTSLITGYPGETESDFKKLLKFIRDVKFDFLSVFKYSREKGTKAYSMDNQVDYRTKELRFKTLINEQSKIVDSLNKRLKNKEFEVLFDSASKARSYRQAPDIDGYIEVIDSSFKTGDFARVKIISSRGYTHRALSV